MLLKSIQPMFTSMLLVLCFSSVLAQAVEPEHLSEDDESMAEYDPFESFNRVMFDFHFGVDRFLFKPIARGYTWVTPDPLERGVSNAFDNILEPRNVINDLLQAKFRQAGVDTSRFVINTTVGLLGLFDVAAKVGLEKAEGEDFGQTLASWGVPDGPYIFIPFLGPSSARDGASLFVDARFGLIGYVDHVPTRNTLLVFQTVDTRASLLAAENLISGDRYAFIRQFYRQRREFQINDGAVEDDFGSDNFGGDEYGDDPYSDEYSDEYSEE